MDVVRLGLPYNSTYLQESMIEGYTSMIWTERYRDPGEFELKTPLVTEMLALLPEMTLISHRETNEVMMVESRVISTDDDGHEELTIKGRSLDAFLEHRYVNAPYGKKRKMAKDYSAAGAAQVLVWNAIDNASGKDVTREGDFSWNTKDAIPNVAVSDGVSDYGDNRRWWIQEGELYPQLMNILIRGDLGIKTIRPQQVSMQRVSVATNLEDRGTITRASVGPVNALQFHIYQGKDRSHDQSILPVIGFSYLRDDIDNAEYLFSVKDFKTGCEVMTSVTVPDIYRNNTEKNYTGLQRRVMAFDAGEPDLPEKPTYPGKNASDEQQNKYDADLAEWESKTAEIMAEFIADAQDDALRALKKTRRVSLFSGDISPMSNYVYGKDYGLGDLVTLYGKYGETQKMVVSEYVRTEDAEGDSGYPGLVLP